MDITVSSITDKNQTLGILNVFGEPGLLFTCVTLEPPWKDNKRRVSCIPQGEYVLKFRKSGKFGDHFHITDVDNRSYILIHVGNYTKDTSGCILVGKSFWDINKDGVLDITSSTDTMNALRKLLGKDTHTLYILRGK